MQLLRWLALVGCDELLLQLREEVLARGHEVRHVACFVLLFGPSWWLRLMYLESPMHRCSSLVPSRPGPCDIPTAGLWESC
jgi:hypothetical protein